MIFYNKLVWIYYITNSESESENCCDGCWHSQSCCTIGDGESALDGHSWGSINQSWSSSGVSQVLEASSIVNNITYFECWNQGSSISVWSVTLARVSEPAVSICNYCRSCLLCKEGVGRNNCTSRSDGCSGALAIRFSYKIVCRPSSEGLRCGGCCTSGCASWDGVLANVVDVWACWVSSNPHGSKPLKLNVTSYWCCLSVDLGWPSEEILGGQRHTLVLDGGQGSTKVPWGSGCCGGSSNSCCGGDVNEWHNINVGGSWLLSIEVLGVVIPEVVRAGGWCWDRGGGVGWHSNLLINYKLFELFQKIICKTSTNHNWPWLTYD